MGFMAAKQANAPLIIEYSLWQAKSLPFGGGIEGFDGTKNLKYEQGSIDEGMVAFFDLVHRLAESPEYKDIPVGLHVDHFPDEHGPIAAMTGTPREVYGGREWAGSPSLVNSVSFDAKGFQGDLDRIIATTLEIARVADEMGGIAFEAEPTEIGEGVLTRYPETRKIAKALAKAGYGIDWYAPGLGSVHGQTSTTGKSPVRLDKAMRHREIMSEALGMDYLMPLAFHGSSGFDNDQLAEAVGVGGTKFNTCTKVMGFHARALFDYLAANVWDIADGAELMKSASAYGHMMASVSDQVVPKLVERMGVVGGAGKAAEAMAYVRPPAGQ